MTGLVSASLVLVSACGGPGASAPRSTVTATTTVTTSPTPTEPAATAQPSPTPPSVQTGVVPAVVGLNHQLAQDSMQAAGFYYLTEEDATGQGRLLVNDRNWVVVSQDPPPGTRAAADTKIVLRSKKLGE